VIPTATDAWTRRQDKARWIRDALRVSLVDGVWNEDVPFPDDSTLMREFAAGRNVIREAVRLLVSEGLLERRPGAGTRPVGRQFVHDANTFRTSGKNRRDSRATQTLLSWTKGGAPSPLARALRVPVGSPIITLEQLDTDGGPIVMWSTVVGDRPGLRPPSQVGEPSRPRRAAHPGSTCWRDPSLSSRRQMLSEYPDWINIGSLWGAAKTVRPYRPG